MALGRRGALARSPGAATARGSEALAPHRVHGAAGDDLARQLRSYRAGEERDAMCVVRGAIERVDDEARLVCARAMRPALLGQDRNSGGALPKAAQDHLLGSTVGVGDEVDPALEEDL